MDNEFEKIVQRDFILWRCIQCGAQFKCKTRPRNHYCPRQSLAQNTPTTRSQVRITPTNPSRTGSPAPRVRAPTPQSSQSPNFKKKIIVIL